MLIEMCKILGSENVLFINSERLLAFIMMPKIQ
jgi:hypothetical protein